MKLFPGFELSKGINLLPFFFLFFLFWVTLNLVIFCLMYSLCRVAQSGNNRVRRRMGKNLDHKLKFSEALEMVSEKRYDTKNTKQMHES